MGPKISMAPCPVLETGPSMVPNTDRFAQIAAKPLKIRLKNGQNCTIGLTDRLERCLCPAQCFLIKKKYIYIELLFDIFRREARFFKYFLVIF